MNKITTIMKQKLLFVAILLCAVSFSAFSQINLEKIVKNGKKKAENKIENRIENKIDQGVDNTLDEIEGSVKKGGNAKADKEDKANKKDKKGKSKDKDDDMVGGNDNTENSGKNNQTAEPEKPKSPTVIWNKFDFIPGDKIIFEDAPSASEENGEFPSKWDLNSGVAEIMNVDGENVIAFLAPNTEIVPFLKDAKQDYLPEIFTIEMDIFFVPGYSNRYYISLNDKKNQKQVDYFAIYVNEIEIGDYKAAYPEKAGNNDKLGGWRHISIAFTNGKLKAYMDDTRIINIPHYDKNPTGLTIEGELYSNDTKVKYVKNVRIAEGGVKYYDRAMQDGKIVVNGIRFDTGKATLRPESMGPINEIYNLMVKQPELNFSIEGHTDSDGDDATNQKLSEERAKTVMNQLITMGIDKSRLKSQGFGESKPLNENTSAEGKSQNRRVEFVKF